MNNIRLITLLACLAFTIANEPCSPHSIVKNEVPKRQIFDRSSCESVEGFTQELREEIQSKAPQVNKIIDLVINGSEKHSTYNELALFCDTFGPRLSGSDSLDQAILYMSDKMRIESKLEMRSEKAMIPKWEVGEQWAEIKVDSVRHKMSILALGTSVGTDNKTIDAEVQVVHTFDQLHDLGRQSLIKGKIVVYNYNFTSYGESVAFRSRGAREAAKYGALAALTRSVAPFSIYSPHAGMGSKSIPTAAITLEDADLIQRWTDRGKQISMRLYIEAKNFADVESKNVIGDIVGNSKPEEVVLVSGHIDSWYNTAGAMDDGGGMMISYKALDVLQKLNLRARRTIRAALWTSEEFGLVGVQQYFKNHKQELNKFKAVMESDLGTFRPLGLSIDPRAKTLAKCIVSETLSLTRAIGTTRLDSSYEGSDITLFSDAGVPGLSLANENSKYFWYHHTSGDSITIENPDDLDKATILWAAASYVLADLSVELPRAL